MVVRFFIIENVQIIPYVACMYGILVGLIFLKNCD